MSCNHCRMMDDYYSARLAQEWRAEQYAIGYDTETKVFYRDIEKRIVFKDWLRENRNA